jgi:tetratricopeptide (TPR) repeat protein
VLFAPDRATRLATAEVTLTKALSLASEHAVAHAYLGTVLIHTNRVAQGIAEYERALAIDRNRATSRAVIGLALIYSGRPAETEAHINEALRLSPRDTYSYLWIYFAGLAKLHLGKDEEAVKLLRRSIEINRNYPTAHFWLASASANLGRLAEAQAAVQAGLSLHPSFTIAYIRAGPASDNPTYLAQRERLLASMLKAGVPEG